MALGLVPFLGARERACVELTAGASVNQKSQRGGFSFCFFRGVCEAAQRGAKVPSGRVPITVPIKFR